MDIGGFAPLQPLGRGGLGMVYRSTRLSTGGDVALKVLLQLDGDDAGDRRAQRELAALLQLQGHPHVVHVEEILHSEFGPVLVMEFAPGGTVLDYMDQVARPFSIAETTLVARHVASALADAHRLGIVHRDIKPHNLLIGRFGQVKVCDFGIAALTRSEAFHEHTSALSYRYASPEERNGATTIGPATDIYSLGVTLIHLVTGALPPSESPEQALAQSLKSGDDALAIMCTLVTSCLQVRPEWRPTADTVLREFEQFEMTLREPARSLARTGADVQHDADDPERTLNRNALRQDQFSGIDSTPPTPHRDDADAWWVT